MVVRIDAKSAPFRRQLKGASDRLRLDSRQSCGGFTVALGDGNVPKLAGNLGSPPRRPCSRRPMLFENRSERCLGGLAFALPAWSARQSVSDLRLRVHIAAFNCLPIHPTYDEQNACQTAPWGRDPGGDQEARKNRTGGARGMVLRP